MDDRGPGPAPLATPAVDRFRGPDALATAAGDRGRGSDLAAGGVEAHRRGPAALPTAVAGCGRRPFVHAAGHGESTLAACAEILTTTRRVFGDSVRPRRPLQGRGGEEAASVLVHRFGGRNG